MEISTTFHLVGNGDKSAMGEAIAAEVKRTIEAKFGPAPFSGEGLAIAGLSVAITAVGRSRFELTVFTDDPRTNNDFNLADRLVEVAGQVRDGVLRGAVKGKGGQVGRFATVFADDPEAEPAYTVIGVYIEGDDCHQRYATTVYTDDGPEAAEALAQARCRQDNQDDTGENLLEIAAVIAGEVDAVA